MQIYLPVEGEDVKFASRRSECNLVRNGMTHFSYKVQNTLVSLEGAETLHSETREVENKKQAKHKYAMCSYSSSLSQ